MKVFILEDDAERIRRFYDVLEGHEIRYTDYVEEAKSICLKTEFDILLLDHDLDHEVYVDSNKANTGYQFAKWFRDQGLHVKEIVIHSMNPVGAENMKHALEGCAEKV